MYCLSLTTCWLYLVSADYLWQFVDYPWWCADYLWWCADYVWRLADYFWRRADYQTWLQMYWACERSRAPHPAQVPAGKFFTFKENLWCRHSNLCWVGSCYKHWLRNIKKVWMGHLLDSIVAPALHKLPELFEGDPISDRFDGQYIWSRYFEWIRNLMGPKAMHWTITKIRK